MQLFKCAAILLLTGYALAMTRLQVEQRMGLMESNFKKSGDVGAPAPLPPIKYVISVKHPKVRFLSY